MNSLNGKLAWCKECVNELYLKLLNKYNGDVRSAMIHLCLVLDVYFSEKLFIECSTNEESFSLSEYFRRVNGEKSTKNMSGFDNSVKIDEDGNKKIAIGDDLVDADIIDFWGEGFNSNEYIKLENKYKKYVNHYPSERLQEQEIIKSLCQLELMREKSFTKGDLNAFDKLSTQISKRMEELNVLPSKMAKYGEDKNMTIGKLIETIEKEEPIPNIYPEFNDLDRIKWMLDRYFINPFKKVFGLDNNISYEDVENDTYENSKK